VLERQERSAQVDGHQIVHVRRAFTVRHIDTDARVADHGVDLAELRDATLECPLPVGFVAHIQLNVRGLVALLL